MSELQKKNKQEDSEGNIEKSTKLKGYVKYSGIAIQMGIIVVAGTFGGLEIDRYLSLSFPLFTLGFSLLSVALAIYLAIKDIIKYNS